MEVSFKNIVLYSRGIYKNESEILHIFFLYLSYIIIYSYY